MLFARRLLQANALLFVIFGAGFIIAPSPLARWLTDGAPQAASALIDMRAMYGGVSLGLGLFFALAAAHAAWLRPALLATLLVLGGAATGRLVGIVVGGPGNGFMFLLLGAELLFAGLALLGLRRFAPAV